MEALVAQILQASKSQVQALNPRLIFLREFDRLLSQGATEENLQGLERLARSAGISEVELIQRKRVLAWGLAQAA